MRNILYSLCHIRSKVFWLITILVFISIQLVFAGQNEKYSYKNFMDKTFNELDPKEFNDSTIIGSCFAQQPKIVANALSPTPPEAYEDIFPNGLSNVVFEKCNLDNVLIKAGMTVIGGTNKRIRTMNDWEDWILDADSKPVEPMSKDEWVVANKSIDPKDIPNVKWTAEQQEQFQKEVDDANNLSDN